MRKILFVDRDGTLIKEPDDFQVDQLEKVRLVEGAITALHRLRRFGYSLVMVSNQDGMGTPSFPRDRFTEVQSFVLDIFASQGVIFDDILICPHVPTDHCACRKPRTGLLIKYLKDRLIDWDRSAVIGDRQTDIELAQAIGVRCFHLKSGGGSWIWDKIADELILKPRSATIERRTKETQISISVNLDGSGESHVETGLGFFDHMLEQLARHSNINLSVKLSGDLHIDDHHSIEDSGIALGEALRKALSDKRGIGRYGFSLPMDECRAEALIDLSGRSFTKIEIPFTVERIGHLATEMIPHFFTSFAHAAGMNLHLTVTPGNNHHMAEASFKAVARALRQAVARTDSWDLPTTKGLL
jgi:imidazoleglycerol-phosphate dehydratase/histidinol-phosphatase